MNSMERMKELCELLTNASKAYYQEDREIMSNFEYDRLYDELVELEQKTGVVLAGSPTVTVGYEALDELPKERHESPMLSLDKYISFLFGFLLPFGVAFMLPVFIYITTRIGLTTPEMLASKRKFVILGIFVMAAILTPPDVVSQVMLGVPMLLLYEVGILVSRMVRKKARE